MESDNVEELIKSNADIINRLSANHPGAHVVLAELLVKHSDIFNQITIDLDDMQMSGDQIWVLFTEWCTGDIETFVKQCKRRERIMIEFINSKIPDKTARAHGPQKTIPAIDGAVKKAIETAQAEGKLVRMDEEAEAVNRFFLAMLAGMQAGKNFVTNVKINLNTGDGEWGVFAVHFVELLNRDGTPVTMQPQNETKDMENKPVPKMDESGIHDVL